MTRYFYTDPLAAAWMAKQFGMVLFAESAYGITNEQIEAIKEFRALTRYYIHSDSLHLLEPRDGDIVGGSDSDGFTAAVVSVRKGTFSMETKIVWAGSEQYRRYRDEKIIQRDGKPFFWPEREVA